MRGMPSVVTLSTWVSPRWNRPEPWAVGMIPTSADSGRMSAGPAAVDAHPGGGDALAHQLLGQRPHRRLDLLLAAFELAGQLGHDGRGGLVGGAPPARPWR